MVARAGDTLRRLEELGRAIVSCSKCPRLADYRVRVAGGNPRYRASEYWSRPLPGFGDPQARIVIVGLAPAAHGGNRTGRMFTGDESGSTLMRALHEVGLASKPYSVSRDDGLTLRGVYITAALRCPPPGNRPLGSELANCREYLVRELEILSGARVYVALGRIAWASLIRSLKLLGAEVPAEPGFSHGLQVEARLGGTTRYLIASYHPSPRNTRTGLLNHGMLVSIFRRALELSRPPP